MRDGFTRAADWSAYVGRSSRLLLGLERGEPTGDVTLAAIEEALGWPFLTTELILKQETPDTWKGEGFEDWLESLVSDEGRGIDRLRVAVDDAKMRRQRHELEHVSDNVLLAELARRMGERPPVGEPLPDPLRDADLAKLTELRNRLAHTDAGAEVIDLVEYLRVTVAAAKARIEAQKEVVGDGKEAAPMNQAAGGRDETSEASGADGESEGRGGPPPPGEPADGVVGQGRPSRRKTHRGA